MYLPVCVLTSTHIWTCLCGGAKVWWKCCGQAEETVSARCVCAKESGSSWMFADGMKMRPSQSADLQWGFRCGQPSGGAPHTAVLDVLSHSTSGGDAARVGPAAWGQSLALPSPTASLVVTRWSFLAGNSSSECTTRSFSLARARTHAHTHTSSLIPSQQHSRTQPSKF